MSGPDTCGCGRLKGLSIEKLHAKGLGCTSPNYVCPRLDAERRSRGQKFSDHLNRHTKGAA